MAMLLKDVMTRRVECVGPEHDPCGGAEDAEDGNIVRLICTLPGGPAPTEFRTGDKRLMFVMNRDR